MPLTEKALQNKVRQELKANGYFVIRHQQTLGSHKGFSDLTAIREGITYYIELKAPNGKQSPYQVKFQADIEAHGGKYYLVKSLDDIKPLLDRVQSLF